MQHAVFRTLGLSALAALAACASPEMDARYEQSLAPWKGASADRLLATWGKPLRDETLPAGGRALTWVVRHDLVNEGRNSTSTIVGYHAGATPGAPGISATTAGMPTSAVVPITCTTRFVLQDGVVTSWTFKGVGCGAPTE
jgi:hypothetical protein